MPLTIFNKDVDTISTQATLRQFFFTQGQGVKCIQGDEWDNKSTLVPEINQPKGATRRDAVMTYRVVINRHKRGFLTPIAPLPSSIEITADQILPVVFIDEENDSELEIISLMVHRVYYGYKEYMDSFCSDNRKPSRSNARINAFVVCTIA